MQASPAGPVLDLNRYVPGLLTLIASNLSGGASSAYLSLYAIGIETWRVMVMLANEGRVTAQRIVQLLDADKGAISRTLKTMQERGLVEFEPDESDGRLRHFVFTPEGRQLHDRIIRLALLRETAAISVLSDKEVETLRDLLRRVYVNLPNVEKATAQFSRDEREALGLPADGPPLRRRGGPGAAERTTKSTPGAKSRSANRKRATRR
ncbi:DNA-binding transcriptional regulator, MarR family [Variovorax sp. HW608]|nr:DNA-binding transcriptional regulator, MarR family [Variovorax sp. HW608]